MKAILLVLGILVALLAGALLHFYFGDFISSKIQSTVSVVVPDGYTRKDLASAIGSELKWNVEQEQRFVEALTGIQWDTFNAALSPIFEEKYEWGDSEKEVFLTRSSLFLGFEPDILEYVYVPDVYRFEKTLSPAEIAAIIVEKSKSVYNGPNALEGRIKDGEKKTLDKFVRGEIELLPDLVPFPPQDVELRRENGRLLIAFSTTYYNIGNGQLELVADTATQGIREDVERTVFQNIHRTDSGIRQRPAGVFLWHQEHLHYHFADFVDYILKPASSDISIDGGKLRQKTTFCIRDVSKITGEGISSLGDAKYLICGKEIQGVSVGWGDTYFQTYVDQNIDITDVPSGIYTLTFVVNPDDRFEEMTKDNNISSATIEINKEKGSVKILATEPKENPSFEHIYIKQKFQ